MLRDWVVDEGEAGGSETQGEGAQCQPTRDHSRLELSDSIATGAKGLHDRVEVCAVKDGVTGVSTQGLSQTQMGTLLSYVVILMEETQSGLSEVIGTGIEPFHRVDIDVVVQDGSVGHDIDSRSRATV